MPFKFIETHLFVQYKNAWFYVPERFVDDVDLHDAYCIINSELHTYLYNILKQ
jgi:hypothetical protein